VIHFTVAHDGFTACNDIRRAAIAVLIPFCSDVPFGQGPARVAMDAAASGGSMIPEKWKPVFRQGSCSNKATRRNVRSGRRSRVVLAPRPCVKPRRPVLARQAEIGNAASAASAESPEMEACVSAMRPLRPTWVSPCIPSGPHCLRRLPRATRHIPRDRPGVGGRL
jgi:hypothetical protein